MRRRRAAIERRDYALSPQFPVMVLTGDNWRISDKPSSTYHFHSSLEIGICQSDSAVLEFPDASFPVKAGDVTIVSRGMLHTTYSSPGCRSKWSYIFSEPQNLLAPLLPQLLFHNTNLFHSFLHNYRVVIHPEEMPVISNLVNAIIEEMSECPLNYMIAVRGLFLTLFSKFLTIPSQNAMNPAENDVTMAITPALTYIDQHYAQQFRMETLAELCHLSQSHFRRLFTEIMGCGPLEHLNQTRIEHACHMLMLTQESILSISEKSGFTCLSSFNRHFLAATGTSPTAWRRRMNANQQFTIQCYNGWLQPEDL